MIQSVNLPASAHLQHTLQQISSAHTLQQPLRLQCTLQQISSAHTHCSSHYIFSAYCSKSPVHTHCSSHYIFSAHCSKSPVHTHCSSHYIFSAHCSYNIQCTLQLFYPVHTATTLSGSNTIQYIQCTFEPPQGKPIPLLAYLQDSQ